MTLTFKLQRLALNASLIFYHQSTQMTPIDVEAVNKLVSDAPEDADIFTIAGDTETVIHIGVDEYVRYVL